MFLPKTLILIILSLDRGENATVDLDFYVTLKKNIGTFAIMINYSDVVLWRLGFGVEKGS